MIWENKKIFMNHYYMLIKNKFTICVPPDVRWLGTPYRWLGTLKFPSFVGYPVTPLSVCYCMFNYADVQHLSADPIKEI